MTIRGCWVVVAAHVLLVGCDDGGSPVDVPEVSSSRSSDWHVQQPGGGVAHSSADDVLALALRHDGMSVLAWRSGLDDWVPLPVAAAIVRSEVESDGAGRAFLEICEMPMSAPGALERLRECCDQVGRTGIDYSAGVDISVEHVKGGIAAFNALRADVLSTVDADRDRAIANWCAMSRIARQFASESQLVTSVASARMLLGLMRDAGGFGNDVPWDECGYSVEWLRSQDPFGCAAALAMERAYFEDWLLSVRRAGVEADVAAHQDLLPGEREALLLAFQADEGQQDQDIAGCLAAMDEILVVVHGGGPWRGELERIETRVTRGDHGQLAYGLIGPTIRVLREVEHIEDEMRRRLAARPN